MLTVRQNGLTSDTQKALYTDISLSLAAGKRVFLVVPEQQTLLAEKEAIYRLPPSATLHFEVTNFSRLANTVFRLLGGVAAHYANATSKAVLVWRALSEAAPLFQSKEMEKPSAANVAEAARAISEMQSLGIDADMLKEAANNERLTPSLKLRNKLCDLSALLSCYQAVLSEAFDDNASDTEKMTKLLGSHPDIFSDAAFFFDGFTSFTQPQFSLLSLLLSRADVTVSLILPKSDEEGFIFAETRQTKNALLRLADMAGVPKRALKEESFNRLSGIGHDRVTRHLWHFDAKIDEEDRKDLDKHVKMYEANSPYEEAAFIASDIKRLVESGAKYQDFAIIGHDAASLDGIIKASLCASDIPVFLAEKRPVSGYEPFMAITAAYRTILFGFLPDDLFAYAKCGFSTVSKDALSEFEIYVKRYKIKGNFFLYPEKWSMNPAGYSDRLSEDAGEILARIDQTRHAVLDPLSVLLEDAKAATDVKAHASALYRFLCTVGMEEALTAKALALHAKKDPAASDYARLFSVLLNILDTLAETAGNVKVDAKQFAQLLSIVFSAADIGRIPAAFDEVTLGIADTLRITGKKYVYLIDVNQGVFPSNAKDPSHFTDKEKVQLSSIGLPTSIGEDLRIARERFSFSRAFAAGSEGVTLITTARNAALKAQAPSDIMKKITEMTSGSLKIVPISALPVYSSVYAPIFAIKRLSSCSDEKDAIKEALAETSYGAQMKMSGNIQNKDLSLSSEAAKELYPERITLSDSRLSQYVNCPFSHFCRYVLRLDEQKDAEIGALHIGNIIHEVLEKYFASLKAPTLSKDRLPTEQNEMRTCSEEEKNERVKKAAEDVCQRLFGADARTSLQKQHFLDRLTSAAVRLVDSVAGELNREENPFIPSDFELRVGSDGGFVDSFVVKDENGQTEIIGKVDRVDTFTEGDNVYVRVMDYKTGTKVFSPSDLSRGINLQMFLYLRAITESQTFARRYPQAKAILPAGVFYVPVSPDGMKAQTPSEAEHLLAENKAEYHGMALNDTAVLRAVGSDYFPIKYNKDGSPEKRTLEKLYSLDEWKNLQNTVETAVKVTSNDLRSGKICATPMIKGSRAACDFCSFRAICRSVS